MLNVYSNNLSRTLSIFFLSTIGGSAFLAGVFPAAAQNVAVSKEFIPAGEPFVFGGNGGVYKAETKENYLAGPITELRVCAGARIDSIQVKYGDRWGTKYGGAGGNCKNVKVPKGQTIKHLTVRHGAGIDGFYFWIGDQTHSFGGLGGVETRVTPPTPNATLGYIEARAGNLIDQLRLVYAERRTVIDKTATSSNVVIAEAKITPNPPTPAPAPVPREPRPASTGQSTTLNIAGPAGEAVVIKEGDPRPQQYFLDMAADRCADPGNLMLDGWTTAERPILEAAGRKLIAKKGYDPNNMASLIAKLKADPKLRWEFAPFMIENTWDALLATTPTPAQAAFISRFEKWAACDRNLTARRTLIRWNQHVGKSDGGTTIGGVGIEWIDPNPQYKTADWSLVAKKGPSYYGFDVTNDGNPMYIGWKGRIALATLFSPLQARQTPETDGIQNLRYIQEDFSGTAIAGAAGGSAAFSGILAVSVGAAPVFHQITVIGQQIAAEAGIKAFQTTKSLAANYAAQEAAEAAFKVTKQVIAKAIKQAFAKGATKAATQGATQAATTASAAAGTQAGVTAGAYSAGATAGVVSMVVIAAVTLGQELAEIIQTKVFEDAITYDARNVTPYEVSAALGPNPGELEKMAVYSLLLKMVVAEPADRNTLSLELPVFKCPIEFIEVGDSCKLNVGFFGRPGLSLADAKKIAAERGLRLANPSEIELAWSMGTLNQFSYGMMADGKFAVPVQRDYSLFKKGANIGVTGGNQGFFYLPAFSDNTAAAPGGTFIQNGKEMSAFLSVTAGAPFAEMDKAGASWKIVKTGDYVRIQSIKSPTLFAYVNNGKLAYAPMNAASPLGHWKIKHADEKFFRIESVAQPHRYIHMENGGVDVGHIEPNWKGALWHMPGYVE